MVDNQIKDMPEMACMAAARGKVYGFFALLFRAEPSEQLIKQLKSAESSEILSDLGICLGDEFFKMSGSQLLEDLAVEFTRLFIGPGAHISPYESVHVEYENAAENTLMGTKTVMVKRFIEATGLNYNETFSGLPDHISAEFELMQKLAEREHVAWAQHDQLDAQGIQQIQNQFFSEHVLQWIPGFCDKAIEQANRPFYRELAGAVKRFIAFENESLSYQKIPVKTVCS